jgi:DNA-binding winged helix-turn-helix (wHTH) protein/TolB-like protein/Tfp pilus assembly protein PilF
MGQMGFKCPQWGDQFLLISLENFFPQAMPLTTIESVSMIERSSRRYYSFGHFELHPARRALLSGGKLVPLAPKAVEMLLLLVENRGRVLEKQELLEYLWPESIVEEANLSQTIYLLRRALAEGSDGEQYVETIPKRGYRFIAPVVETPNEKTDVTEREPVEAGLGGRSRRTMWVAFGALAVLIGVVTFASYMWFSRSAVKTEQGGPVRSLAVLPFKPLSAEGDNYLGLGMADVLITRLSDLNQIVVQPTSAVRKYDAPDAHPLVAGLELKVDAVLEGTLQKTADRLRLTLRLHDVRNGRTIWSGKFDEKFTDIFKVQDSISDQVAAALALNLSRERRALMFRSYTDNAAAYELYLKGRYWWNKRTVDGLKKAVDYFEQTIALSPNYALAYAGLADCYNLLSILEAAPPQEAFPKARAAAVKALEIDDTLAEARASLGWIKWVYDWDWPGSEREFKRAIEISPGYATAYDWYAVCLAQIGQFDQALAQLRQAQRHDPLSLVIQVHIGWVYYYSGQYDRAIEQYQRALEMDPSYIWARVHLSQAYVQRGMYTEAIAELQQAVASSPINHRHLAGLAHIFAVSGRQGESRRLLDDLLEREKKQYVSPYSIAMVYAGLEEKKQALAWLRKGAEQRAGRMVRLQFDHRFKNLRSDPQFIEMLRRINPAPQGAATPALADLGQRHSVK